jgi:excisionase family DNA binding protein
MTFLTITETASRLRVSVPQVRQLIKSNKDFPIFAYGKKTNRVIAEKLDKWVESNYEKTKGVKA